MKKHFEWLVRVETKKPGYLSTSSKHQGFKTEKGARNYIQKIEKKNPDCECVLYHEESKDYKQEQLPF